MAQQWIYIPSDPRTDTQYEPNGYYIPSGGGTRVSGGMSSGSYNKTGFTDAELAYAYALMMALSGGVADMTYAERMGYTAPVRVYNPFVFRPGQAGVKALIHFEEVYDAEPDTRFLPEPPLE